MKQFIQNMHGLGTAYIIFGVIVTAVAVFAVLPSLPEADSSTELVSTRAHVIFAFGDGDSGGNGGGDSGAGAGGGDSGGPGGCCDTGIGTGDTGGNGDNTDSPSMGDGSTGGNASGNSTNNGCCDGGMGTGDTGGNGDDSSDGIGDGDTGGNGNNSDDSPTSGGPDGGGGDSTPTPTPISQPSPSCVINASPSTIERGQSISVTWTSQNGSSATLNGSSVSLNGNQTFSPNNTTTFTFVVTGPGGRDTCAVTVNVDEDNENSPSCDLFSVSDDEVEEGDSVTLRWETTGGDEVRINQGIGEVSSDGSESVRVDDDTTWTLTVTNNDGSDTCSVSVDVEEDDDNNGGGGGGSSAPRCDFEASDDEIVRGDEVILSWDNTRTNEIIIEDEDGNIIVDSEEDDDIDEDEDSITVMPTKDMTYTLTASRGSREDDCEVDIEVRNDVTVKSTRTQLPLVVALNTVPYTGFDAGPVLTTIFYMLLVLWALCIAYVLVLKKSPLFGKKSVLATAGGTAHVPVEPITSEAVFSPVAEAMIENAVPLNLPTAAYAPVIGYTAQSEIDIVAEAEGADLVTWLEQEANERMALVSSEVMRKIIDSAHTREERLALLDRIVNGTKAAYPSEEGWIIINKERMNAVLA